MSKTGKTNEKGGGGAKGSPLMQEVAKLNAKLIAEGEKAVREVIPAKITQLNQLLEHGKHLAPLKRSLLLSGSS
jgi:hypothetical protein